MKVGPYFTMNLLAQIHITQEGFIMYVLVHVQSRNYEEINEMQYKSYIKITKNTYSNWVLVYVYLSCEQYVFISNSKRRILTGPKMAPS